MNKNLRLKEAREKKRITQDELASKIGVFPSYIAALETRKSYGFKTAAKLAKALDTTVDWLLDGDEKVIIFEDLDNVRTLTVAKRKGVPYYNLEQMALIKTNFSDINEEPEFYVDAKPMNDCTAYIPVYGDAMAPEYTNGMIVGTKEQKNLDLLISGGAYYVITDDSANNLKIMRYVYNDEDNEKVLILKSKNPNYPGKMVLDKSAILSIHLLKGRFIIDHA